MTKILYLYEDYKVYQTKLQVKIIDYNVRYAYNAYFPATFKALNMMMSPSYSYQYRPAI